MNPFAADIVFMNGPVTHSIGREPNERVAQSPRSSIAELWDVGYRKVWLAASFRDELRDERQVLGDWRIVAPRVAHDPTDAVS